jgi:penicillin-binding protein 2
MKQRLEERRPAITPQLAVRVAVLGGFAFVLFAIVFFRLWFLQVLSGDQYVSEARSNRVRKIKIEAPRGDIVDRNGNVLVKTRIAPVVQIIPSQLPQSELDAADAYRTALSGAERTRLAAEAKLNAFDQRLKQKDRKPTRRERRDRRELAAAARKAPPVAMPPIPEGVQPVRLYRRLGHVLQLSPKTIHRRVIEGVAEASYRNITIRTDVPSEQFNYLLEHRERFPGVDVEKLYLRDYPHDDLAAQLFGTVSEVTPDELKEKKYRGVSQGTRIGQSGLEEQYDRYLRGTDGYTRVVVNALGSRDDTRRVTRREPIQGEQLRLSLDLGLEQAADDAIQRGIGAANQNLNPAKAGAYVAMNPRTGEIYALGSYPSFDANELAKPITQKRYDELTSQARGAPLFNRAIAATYPTGSIFKPITAIATMESGVVTPDQTIVDDGEFKLGPQVFKNAKGAHYGALQMARALTVSSDVFFYTLGSWAFSHGGNVIQKWARRLGLDHRTGIDVPGEFGGLVPDKRWRDEGYEKYLTCTKKAHVQPQTTAALYKCGGIERPWSAGDNVNLAIGQGDLLATPLQMAVAYSSLANGGTVPRPHLGAAIEDGHGRVIQEIRKSPRRHVKINQRYLDTIMSGLLGATTDPKGTSADVFKGFPYKVYGKTGTAEHPGQADQSWYACYVPNGSRSIVVVVTIEKGGFGAESAAPAARLILSKWFGLGEHDFKVGTSQTR